MAIDYDKFNEIVDFEGLKKDMEENQKKGRNKIPDGVYDMALLEMELGETGPNSTNPGSPMVKGKFEIIGGDLDGRWAYMNQPVNNGVGMNICLHFIRSMFPDNGKYVVMRDAFHPDAITSASNPFRALGEGLDKVVPFIMDNFEYSIKVKNRGQFYSLSIEEVYDLNEED